MRKDCKRGWWSRLEGKSIPLRGTYECKGSGVSQRCPDTGGKEDCRGHSEVTERGEE